MTPIDSTDLVISSKDLIKSRNHYINYVYSEEEKSKLTNTLDIGKVISLSFESTLSQNRNENYRFLASVSAIIVQNCIITLAPVKTKLNFTVERHYCVRNSVLNSKITIPNILKEEVEYLEKTLDVNEVIFEALSLEIPDYPRRKNAQFKGISVTQNGLKPLEEPEDNPFSALKDLIS